MMTDGITVKILGDYGPFSRIGKSIGYWVTIGQSNYLLDCGAPLFQQIGGDGLKDIDGLIMTHCHDDHKRWYSDVALFNMFAADIMKKVTLFTSENINEELVRASAPALDRSLSADSKSVIDIPYEEYVNLNVIGPRARYKVDVRFEDNGIMRYCISDQDGNRVNPDSAKIIINPKTKRYRMLFKDPDYKEWVEPESFYPFSSTVFYEEEQNIYVNREGFTIQAIKAPIWHGVPAIGIRISTGAETVVFSSDTVHDSALWTQLYTEKRVQKFKVSKSEFESASVIYGDINDYIERVWSEERYRAAINAFKGAVVIHDVAGKGSIVHTDYEKLKTSFLHKDKTLLTHSPDKITSEWVLCNSEKTIKIKGDRFFEVVDGKLFHLDADIYHREGGRYYVGYKDENGEFLVCEGDGLLDIVRGGTREPDNPLYKVSLYEDISGKYFPATSEADTLLYERRDGKVERIEFDENGSSGKILENYRSKQVSE